VKVCPAEPENLFSCDILSVFIPRSLLMFTMENALIVALSQACRYLRDPSLDPRIKQFLKRELGSELVSLKDMTKFYAHLENSL